MNFKASQVEVLFTFTNFFDLLHFVIYSRVGIKLGFTSEVRVPH
jgi:hypothetical protein